MGLARQCLTRTRLKLIHPPPWRFGAGPTTQPSKKHPVTETSTTRNQATRLGTEGSSTEESMTFSGESQRTEATAPTTLLSTRKTINIGTWNVQTMYQTGKAAQIAKEMNNYKLSILGISETRWTKSGQKRLASGELILYSGHEEEGADHSEGVGFMLSSDAQQALIGWEALGPRFITATFKTKHKKIKMNVVMAYAPTNSSSEEVKIHFYDQLQAILESFKDRDINILMGDFNAKVGSDNTGYETCMGKHGTGEMNENGEMFADVCALFSYVIGGTIFAHKNIHKGTWVSPDHVTINQIDHICISKKFRRSLQDVKVRRGADVASDHHLVAAKLKLKLKKNWSSEPRRKARYNVNYLKDQTVREQYGITLNNRFDILQEMIDEDEGITVEQHWNAVKNTFNTTCEETLGRKKGRTERMDLG